MLSARATAGLRWVLGLLQFTDSLTLDMSLSLSVPQFLPLQSERD